MSEYSIEFETSAFKSFAKLPLHVQQTLQPVIDAMAANPRPPRCEKLESTTNGYRLRKGDYRIVYAVDDAQRIVTITRVRHRKDAYRRL